MKKFNFIIIILLAIVLGLSIYIAVQPDDSAFVRSKRIEADPQLVFENVNNLEKWKAWSPWYRMSDSLTTESLGTSVSGEGAQLEWSSGAHIGKVGILKSRPMDSLWHSIKIDNVPQAYSYWSFKRVPSGTEVSWGIDRNRIPFLLKCYAVINGGLDKVFAAEYELGLTRLDSVLRMETAKFSVDIQGIRE